MAEEQEKDGTIQFDKQAYLISYFDDIAETVKNINYEYVYLLNTTPDASFSTTLATLTDKIGVDSFTQLKTYQYNSLIPRIRLYRIEYNSDKSIKAQKEFKFIKDAKYTIDSVTNTILKDNSGIKSINWKLAGSNPVTAEKQIEVQIQFYFDSINAFSGGSYDKMVSAWYNASKETETDPYKLENFSFCDDETTTRNYWSLLFHPQSEKDTYDTFKFRIKAMVGWEDLSDNFKQQLNLNDADESIKKLNYAFFLNLIKHQFTLNEDGSLQVTADYVASFENETNNYDFNIFGSLPDVIKKISTIAPKDTDYDIRGLKTNNNEIEKLKESSGLSDEEFKNLYEIANNTSQQDIEKAQKLYQYISDPQLKQQLIGCGAPESIVNPSLISSTSINATAAASEKVAENLANISSELTALAVTAYKRKYYSYFINKLMENPSGKEKFFSLVIKPSEQESWKKWYTKKTSIKPKFGKSPNSSNSATQDAISETQTELNRLNIEYEETFVESYTNTVSDWVEAGKEYMSDPKDIKIVFTTFGCIVETAYEVIKDHLDGSFIQGSKVIPIKKELVEELGRLKTILGNISDENQIFNYNNTNNKISKIKNLAFAPIEISLLKNFLIENIIKPKKETYSLFSFLKDALSTLVITGINSFGTEQNEEVDKYANVSLSSNILTLGNNKNEDPLKSLFLIGNSSILDASTIISNKPKLDAYYVNNINTNHNVYYNYNLLYDKTLKDFLPKNDPIKDGEMGVYHYTYGQDYGLVKGINFAKIDQPYLKEAKAVGKETFYLGQFRDRYNADLTMIGNNIYYPGMMLYIRPSIETSIQVSAESPNFSQISGIGGYYFVIEVESSITEDGYETKLKTIWHSDGFEPTPTSLSQEEQCKALLQDAGLTSENGNSAVTAVQAVVNQITKQALIKEKETLLNELDKSTVDIGFSNWDLEKWEFGGLSEISQAVAIVTSDQSFEQINKENEQIQNRIAEIEKQLKEME